MSDHPPGPADLEPRDDAPIRWWRPGWGDVIAQVGVGWLLLTAVAGLVGVPLAGAVLFFAPGLLAASFKLMVLLVGGFLALLGYVVRRAVQARREPFCIFCGYSLTGLPDHYRCPECGRPYTWRQIDEYRQDPQWFIERWKARRALPPADPPMDARPSQRRSRDGTS